MISAAMFVKDEAKYIEAALTSLVGIADEIQIVDTGSTDGTPDLVRALDIQVPINLTFEDWHEDFAWHRNHVQSLCSGDWIFVLDGDERVIEAGDVVEKITTTGYDSVYVNLNCEVDSGRLERHPAIRAYRKDRGYWTYPIHNQLEGVETADKSSAVIWCNYADGMLGPKTRRSVPMLIRYHEEHPYDAHPMFFLAKTFRSLGDWENTAIWSERTRQVMGHDPRYALIYVWLVESAIMRGDYGDANRFVDEGVHRHPGFGQMYHCRMTMDAKRWLEGVANPGRYLWLSQPSAEYLKNLPEASKLLGMEIQYGLDEEVEEGKR